MDGMIRLLDKRKKQHSTTTRNKQQPSKRWKFPKTSAPNYHHSVGENLAKGSHTATVNLKQQGEGWKVACFVFCDVESL